MNSLKSPSFKRGAGIFLLVLGDACHATAILLAPLWMIQLMAPHAGYGSAIVVGPAVFLFAVAITQPPFRACLMACGLCAALFFCAVAWPIGGWWWLAFYSAGVLLTHGSWELTSVKKNKITLLSFFFAIAGFYLAPSLLHLQPRAIDSINFTYLMVLWTLTFWAMYKIMKWVIKDLDATIRNTE